MVVDDDLQVRKLTVTALSYSVNREVVSFGDGEQAWEYIQNGADVDIILSDVDMPVMDGFELMAKVQELYPEKIFIIMSGIPGYEPRAEKEGASAFLGKPFGINDLFNIVQYYVVEQPQV